MCCSANNVVERLLQLIDFLLENNAADPRDLAASELTINTWAEKYSGK